MQENKDDREIRTRKETAKGQEFRIQLLKDQRTSAQRAWRKQLNKVENVLADSGETTLSRNLLETKMKILFEAHEHLDEALEGDFGANQVATQTFEIWEKEHTDVLRGLNHRISELKQETLSVRSSRTDKKSRSRRSSRAFTVSTPDRKVDIAAKVAKLKTELIFAEAEVERTAVLKKHEEKLKKFKLTKELAVARAEMDAVAKFEENELDVRLEDILPEIPDKNDLLQNYLTTQVNSACERSLQTLLTDVESPSERPFLEAEENSNPVYNYQANQRQRSANPKAPTESFSPYPKMLNPFVPAYVPASTPFPSQSETVDPLTKNIVHNGSRDFTSPKPSSRDALERPADLSS